MKETELALQVVDWLESQHWEVYQEVQPRHTGRTADIVAVNRGLTWVVECKTSLSLQLLEQAMLWRGRAHYISIATPSVRNRKGHNAAQSILRHNGIGWIKVQPQTSFDGSMFYSVAQIEGPRLHRKIWSSVQDNLNEQHKHFAKAGNSEGKRWTPFQQTCLNLQRIVRDNPGVIFKDAMSQLSHHYNKDSTARSTLARYLHSGSIVKGVVARKEGKYLRLYLEGEA